MRNGKALRVVRHRSVSLQHAYQEKCQASDPLDLRHRILLGVSYRALGPLFKLRDGNFSRRECNTSPDFLYPRQRLWLDLNENLVRKRALIASQFGDCRTEIHVKVSIPVISVAATQGAKQGNGRHIVRIGS